jgi:hypothetical protein
MHLARVAPHRGRRIGSHIDRWMRLPRPCQGAPAPSTSSDDHLIPRPSGSCPSSSMSSVVRCRASSHRTAPGNVEDACPHTDTARDRRGEYQRPDRINPNRRILSVVVTTCDSFRAVLTVFRDCCGNAPHGLVRRSRANALDPNTRAANGPPPNAENRRSGLSIHLGLRTGYGARGATGKEQASTQMLSDPSSSTLLATATSRRGQRHLILWQPLFGRSKGAGGQRSPLAGGPHAPSSCAGMLKVPSDSRRGGSRSTRGIAGWSGP